MGFLDHLEELRKRIIWSIVYIAVGFCVCYWWHEAIFGWMQKPIVFALKNHNLPVKLVYTNPIDPFNMYLKISLIVGIFVASPFILYQVWAFIAQIMRLRSSSRWSRKPMDDSSCLSFSRPAGVAVSAIETFVGRPVSCSAVQRCLSPNQAR